MADIPPSQTLYVRNLNERLHKDKLRMSLYAAFIQFGSIIDIVALKTYRLRGQAWVVYSDVASATNAKQHMQGFQFFDQPMDIKFAKSKSDAVSKLDGSYKPRPKRKREDSDGDGKRSESRNTLAKTGDGMEEDADVTSAGGALGEQSANDSAPSAQSSINEPNRILLATSLPQECNAAMLQMLFQQYNGYKEVRMVPGRGMAFVEFNDKEAAGVALDGLKNFKLNATESLQLSFCKA